MKSATWFAKGVRTAGVFRLPRWTAALPLLLSGLSYARTYAEDSETTRLLVVGPQAFERELQPLITHKNNTGIATQFLSMEAIRNTDTPHQGNDAEKLKCAIGTHCLQGGRYVMLVRGYVARSLLPTVG